MTVRYLRGIGPVLALCLLVSPIARAQAPWTVTVTPTMNPLPVGTCGAVRLTIVDPLIRETPRGPSGALVTIADFDLSVTAPDGKSVVGQYLDRSHWSVCACQGGTAGSVATITAKYPGQLLTDRTRVPAIELQTTVDFSLALAKSAWNPAGCPAPPAAAVIAVAGTPTAPLQPAPSALTVTQAAGPVSAPQPAPVPIATGTPRGAPQPGPAPTGVTVTGTPALAHVTWGFVGASSYSVQRWMQSDPTCCRASSPQLGARETGWDDPLPSAGTYVYRVTANYADGRQGFVDVSYLRPEPTNPAVLTVTKLAFWKEPKGFTPGYWVTNVKLEWTKVAGAAYYVLWGPLLPTTGKQWNTTVSNDVGTHQTWVNSTDALIGGAAPLAWGVQTWTVAAFFLPGPVSTVPASFTKGSLDLQPCKTGAVFC